MLELDLFCVINVSCIGENADGNVQAGDIRESLQVVRGSAEDNIVVLDESACRAGPIDARAIRDSRYDADKDFSRKT